MNVFTSDASIVAIVGLGCLLALGLFSAFGAAREERRKKQALAAYRETWGQPFDRERDFALYRRLLELWTGDAPYVDEQTWADLDLDSIYAHVDRTRSSPGEIALYRLLRTPMCDAQELHSRDEYIHLFQTDAEVREGVFGELIRLGRTRYPRGILELLWGELPEDNPLAPLYAGVAVLVAGIAGVALFAAGTPLGSAALTSLGALFMLNLVIHYRIRENLDDRILALRYLSKIIVVGRRIAALNLPGLEELAESLRRQTAAVATIPRATAMLTPERGGSAEIVDIFQQYLAILFLVEVRAFYRVLNQIRNFRNDLRGVFETVGRLDALQSAASFRAGLPYYATPRFTDQSPQLRLEGVFHPLLETPVPNSVTLDRKGCLITGSNMAGKSTFLRTVGVAAVLAQTLSTCPATAYQASFFQILTALSTHDDLFRGKSYYLVEAERLLAMIRSSQSSIPTLCLIDEILRGTNTTERLAASQEILAYLAAQNALVVAATHDIELVDRLADAYDSYHFDVRIDSNDMQFDYKLTPGPARTRNAISLLELLHYPTEIVDNARRRSEVPSTAG